MPPTVEYSLHENCKTLLPALNALYQWAVTLEQRPSIP
ncbi:winged helix-turn-helix transcriptional regulator [Helicobacter heilmannii]